TRLARPLRRYRRALFRKRRLHPPGMGGGRRTNGGKCGSPGMTVPALEMAGITKLFPGVLALDEVDFDCMPGEVHAICGENGAGKSTLMKVLGGSYRPDAGEIRIRGQVVHFTHPQQAKAAGISIIHQELSLLPHRSVAENIFMGCEPSRLGILDRRAMRQRTA